MSSDTDDLINSLHSQLKSGEYSDFIVVCGRQSWDLHRNIVCPRSKFFNAALNGGFQVSVYMILRHAIAVVQAIMTNSDDLTGGSHPENYS